MITTESGEYEYDLWPIVTVTMLEPVLNIALQNNSGSFRMHVKPNSGAAKLVSISRSQVAIHLHIDRIDSMVCIDDVIGQKTNQDQIRLIW